MSSTNNATNGAFLRTGSAFSFPLSLFRPRHPCAAPSNFMAEKKGSSSEKVLYCSFCGKSQHEVKKLIAGPSVFICDECIELCNDIIRDEVPVDAADPKSAKSDLPIPSEIKS